MVEEFKDRAQKSSEPQRVVIETTASEFTLKVQ